MDRELEETLATMAFDMVQSKTCELLNALPCGGINGRLSRNNPTIISLLGSLGDINDTQREQIGKALDAFTTAVAEIVEPESSTRIERLPNRLEG
jgi:hypothetical protein